MQENTPFGVSELLVQAQRMKKWYEEALHAVAVQYGLNFFAGSGSNNLRKNRTN